MRKLEITRQAQRDLAEILDWTVDVFGNAQADKYAAVLDNCIESILSGVVRPRSCDAVTGHPEDKDLYFARAGEHFIILDINDDRIVILSVVHSQRDLGHQFMMIRREKGDTE